MAALYLFLHSFVCEKSLPRCRSNWQENRRHDVSRDTRSQKLATSGRPRRQGYAALRFFDEGRRETHDEMGSVKLAKGKT